MTTKRCPRCERNLPTTTEHWRSTPAGKLDSYCRPCKREYNRLYLQRRPPRGKPATGWWANSSRIRNRDHVYAHLLEHPCVDCGEADPVVLEYDHVRGPKVANVAYLVNRGRSLEAVDAEIAKCEVVCANCHRKRTARRAGTHRFVLGQAAEPV